MNSEVVNKQFNEMVNYFIHRIYDGMNVQSLAQRLPQLKDVFLNEYLKSEDEEWIACFNAISHLVRKEDGFNVEFIKFFEDGEDMTVCGYCKMAIESRKETIKYIPYTSVSRIGGKYCGCCGSRILYEAKEAE